MSSSDPFGREPPPKAFYHPSRQKHLAKQEKQITLSPTRHESAKKKTSAEEDLFLKETNVFTLGSPKDTSQTDDHSSQFEESWPSSERPSYTSLLDETGPASKSSTEILDTLSGLKSALNMTNMDALLRGGNSKSTSRETAAKASVLQNYIDRFRHGTPMSREERALKAGGSREDFWWLSRSPPAPSDTSTPKDEDKPRSRKFTDQGQTDFEKLTKSNVNMLDEATRKLQERADRIIEESGSSFHSSEPVVSTDGLGASTSGSSFEEVPYRPIFVRFNGPASRVPSSSPKTSGVPRKPVRPEDDILQQWRLRRKMEVAQGHSGVKYGDQKNIDSKLEAFRRRLAAPLVSADVRQSAIQFTPDPRTTTSVNKVDAEIQTSKSIEKLNSPSTNPSRGEPEPERRTFKPEIASPTLSRTRHMQRTNPHLHLMCDLLPCPHAEKYAEEFSKVSRASSEFSESDEDPGRGPYRQYLQAEKPHSEEKRSVRKDSKRKEAKYKECDCVNHGKGEQTSVSGNNENDVSSETEPRTSKDVKKVVRLGAREEIPETDSKNLRADAKLSDDLDETKSKKSILVKVSSRTGRKSDVTQKHLPEKEGRESDEGHLSDKKDDDQAAGVSPAFVGKPETRTKFLQPVHSSSPAREAHSVSMAIGQTISEHLFSGSTSAVLSSVDSWASFVERPDSGDKDRQPSSVHPLPATNQPQLSAGQVMPSSHGMSSFNEDAPSSSHKMTSSVKQIPPAGQTLSSAPSRTVASASSSVEKQADARSSAESETPGDVYESDDEFPDDHILKMLRQQRAEYEIKLRQIDELLQQSSFGQR